MHWSKVIRVLRKYSVTFIFYRLLLYSVFIRRENLPQICKVAVSLLLFWQAVMWPSAASLSLSASAHSGTAAQVAALTPWKYLHCLEILSERDVFLKSIMHVSFQDMHDHQCVCLRKAFSLYVFLSVSEAVLTGCSMMKQRFHHLIVAFGVTSGSPQFVFTFMSTLTCAFQLNCMKIHDAFPCQVLL